MFSYSTCATLNHSKVSNMWWNETKRNQRSKSTFRLKQEQRNTKQSAQYTIPNRETEKPRKPKREFLWNHGHHLNHSILNLYIVNTFVKKLVLSIEPFAIRHTIHSPAYSLTHWITPYNVVPQCAQYTHT